MAAKTQAPCRNGTRWLSGASENRGWYENKTALIIEGPLELIIKHSGEWL